MLTGVSGIICVAKTILKLFRKLSVTTYMQDKILHSSLYETLHTTTWI